METEQRSKLYYNPRFSDILECQTFCASLNMPYFAMQFRNPYHYCMCDKLSYGRYGLVEDSYCNKNCVDSFKCGGYDTVNSLTYNSIYLTNSRIILPIIIIVKLKYLNNKPFK
jgi:hypothetical protein